MKKILTILSLLLLLTALAGGVTAFAAEAECTGAQDAAPVSADDPQQGKGEYENEGLKLSIKPEYNDLITVELPKNDPKGLLFTVSETASLEAESFDGAGWLFSIARIGETRLHELLCGDMSGAVVFAKDSEGRYYVNLHPTDVRYARKTPEEMRADSGQWTMLCEWAAGVPACFAELNGLEPVRFGNSAVDILLARAAWDKIAHIRLSAAEFGPVEVSGGDGAPYGAYLENVFFDRAEPEAKPEGKAVSLDFPEDNSRIDFFLAPGGYVRLVSGEREQLYQAHRDDDSKPDFGALTKNWYFAEAEKAGVRR